MKRLGRYLSLPERDRALLRRSALLLAGVRIGLWLLPYRTLRRLLGRLPGNDRGGGRRGARETIERIAWAVTAASRHLPGTWTCLTQALAAEVLLARVGHRAHVRFGVTKAQGGRLKAHAWVESNGEVVVGAVRGPRCFVPLFPLTPERA